MLHLLHFLICNIIGIISITSYTRTLIDFYLHFQLVAEEG